MLLKNKIILVLTMVLGIMAQWPQNANAADPERYTNVSITPERSAVSPGDEIKIVTTIDLEPHWHVYWLNPGDSGLPVKITWDTPKGFEISELNWPTPDKISYDILVNYGYYNSVNLLQTLKVPDMLPKGKITLTAKLEMLVCNEICIPEYDTIKVELNNPENLKSENPEKVQKLLSQTTSVIPKVLKGEFSFEEIKKNEQALLKLVLNPEDRTLLRNATKDNIEFFPYSWGVIQHIEMPEVIIKDGTITIHHARGDEPIENFENLEGLLVIKGERGKNKGFYITAEQKKNDSSSAVVNKGNSSNVENSKKNVQSLPPLYTHPDDMTWLSALYLALFGGLILNLMPCVFPVLSMKALSLVKMGEKDNTVAMAHGIAYTLGVVLSFLFIGGALVIFKEAGSVIGWGFQLQNPIVVGVLAYMLFLIGLNLMGFYNVDMGLGNVGSALTRGQSIGSSFFTGMLATLVATPCTAPFMGAAMGFALTQSAYISMSVFAALGFGLALPYLILSFIPASRKLLPRPGAWMNTFKQFLSFPMFASAIWLVWVLSQQSGSYGVLLILLGMLSLSFAVWLSKIKARGFVRFCMHLAVLFSLILPVWSVTYLTVTEGHSSSDKHYQFGEPYTKEALSEYLSGDEPIFVEMTAAWCITCKLNHAVALNIKSTKDIFQNNNVRYLIGDWTNHDEEITAYLDAFERNGVPLYVFYGARDPKTGQRPKAEILPQVLTPAIVKEMLVNH